MKLDLKSIVSSKKMWMAALLVIMAAGALSWFAVFQKQKAMKSKKPIGQERQQATAGSGGGGSGRGLAVPIARPVARPIAKPVAKPVTTAQPTHLVPSSIPDPSLVRLQQQIRDIIRLNETLRAQNQGQIKEIRRISEQTRIHQQILEDIKTAQESKTDFKTTDAEAILAQEKLRLISADTEKSKQYLESLQRQEEDEQKAGRGTS